MEDNSHFNVKCLKLSKENIRNFQGSEYFVESLTLIECSQQNKSQFVALHVRLSFLKSSNEQTAAEE